MTCWEGARAAAMCYTRWTWLFFLVVVEKIQLIHMHLFLLGYLTGSQRRPGEHEYSRPGLSISGAISLAVDEINDHKPLVDNCTLGFVVAETYGEEDESILQTALLWTRNVSAYVGPQETCVHEARMAASFNLPMMSYFCANFETSDKKLFPTFARTRPPDMQISKSVASVLLTFGWRKIGFLYSSAKEFEFHKIADTIVSTLKHCGIEVQFQKTWDVTYHHGYLENPFLQLVEETFKDIRIYVVLGQYYEHLGLVVTMQKKGLFANGEYFVVGVDIEQYDQDNPGMYLKGLLKDETEEITKTAYQSYMGIVGSPPIGFDNFSVKVNTFMEKPPFNFPNPLTYFGGMKRIRAEAAYLYDAVHVYARALNETLKAGENPYDGKNIFNYMKDSTYESAMGYLVHMDENGDAEGNYTLVARRRVPNNPNEYGLYPIGIFQHIENNSIPILRLTTSINWVGVGVPIDEPTCGFRGEKCVTRTAEIVAGIAGGALLTLLIILLVVFRNWQYEQELDSLLWKIDFRELQLNQPVTSNINGNRTFRSIHPIIRASQISLLSSLDADFRFSNTTYTQTSSYKGHIVATKRLNKKSVDITRKMKKEFKIMRDLRHDNLNSFIGACVDPPNICILTEYCSRGSLRDILENDEVKLDNMFIASLVGDMLQGMIYLHESPIKCHGHLHSGNCLVDSRWVLKITDFGLYEFKDGAEITDPEEKTMHSENLLYVAPELLRTSSISTYGTQKGDVYSFGIILYEIYGRHGPFGQIDMTPDEILKRVIGGVSLSDNLFRPQLELLECLPEYVRICLRECWSETPEERPDFKFIRHKLRPLRKGMRPNILDNMIAMMEKYANNLEALVDEKTEQLIEEKKKTEALLFEMLPRYVAEQLKRGHKVEAESFDCVTIYFSDIVGFTSMSAESTPLQVVDFLNDLYTCFDSIIGSYDVYKVETIGDAYMVVSGLPIRNGDLHAGEIASMSLHLLEAVKSFEIRHRPLDTLKLRIGIHSGPVCAGVVGQKMPRYCLFGDTVNTASRMESNGLPLRIHCSSQCKDILEKLGGYVVEERGIVKMKGKGDVKTFWLTGEDDKQRDQRLLHRRQRLASLQLVSNKSRILKDCLNSQRCSFIRKTSLTTVKPLSLAANASLKQAHNVNRRNSLHQKQQLLTANADSQMVKRSSWPRFGDNPECSPTGVISPVDHRKGCSTAVLFFGSPAIDIATSSLDNDDEVVVRSEWQPLLADNEETAIDESNPAAEAEAHCDIRVEVNSSDYLDKETPV